MLHILRLTALFSILLFALSPFSLSSAFPSSLAPDFTPYLTLSSLNGTNRLAPVQPLASLPHSIWNQTSPFTNCATSTGNNATVIVPLSSEPTFDGQGIENGDEIAVFDDSNRCVGKSIWQGTNTAITVWGDNDQTPMFDGIQAGDSMMFFVWQQASDLVAPAAVTYTQGNGHYEQDGLYILATLKANSNTAPIVEDLDTATDEDIPLDFRLPATDRDQDTLVFVLVASPTNGSLQVMDSTATYTPNPNFHGTDVFRFLADDGEARSDTATVSITIHPINDAPLFSLAPVFVSPIHQASLIVGGPEDTPADPNSPFAVAWNRATDVEQDTVDYLWQLATESSFETPLIAHHTSETTYTTSVGAIAALLDDKNVVLNDSLLLYHRVWASDGQDSTFSEIAELTLVRGSFVGQEVFTEVPDAYVLHQNYPNPFNPVTRIIYSLPQSGHVMLRVFDPTGRIVATLVDYQQTTGTHEVVFDASLLPSGVYFYELIADEAHLTRKLVLMK